jgi:hypothetical protein
MLSCGSEMYTMCERMWPNAQNRLCSRFCPGKESIRSQIKRKYPNFYPKPFKSTQEVCVHCKCPHTRHHYISWGISTNPKQDPQIAHNFDFLHQTITETWKWTLSRLDSAGIVTRTWSNLPLGICSCMSIPILLGQRFWESFTVNRAKSDWNQKVNLMGNRNFSRHHP